MLEGLPNELKTEIIKLLQPVHLKGGEGKTIHISFIYNSVAAYDCLLLNQPSKLIYKALTDTELMVTSFSALYICIGRVTVIDYCIAIAIPPIVSEPNKKHRYVFINLSPVAKRDHVHIVIVLFGRPVCPGHALREL
jgi:hypothetical protein